MAPVAEILNQSPSPHRTLPVEPHHPSAMVIIQTDPRPMGIYGVIEQTKAPWSRRHHPSSSRIDRHAIHGHSAMAGNGEVCLIPSAGSAYTYVARRFCTPPRLRCRLGMVMDYLINPLICTAFCAKAAMNILPGLSFTSGLSFSPPSSPG